MVQLGMKLFFSKALGSDMDAACVVADSLDWQLIGIIKASQAFL